MMLHFSFFLPEGHFSFEGVWPLQLSHQSFDINIINFFLLT